MATNYFDKYTEATQNTPVVSGNYFDKYDVTDDAQPDADAVKIDKPQKGLINDALVGLGKGTMQLPGAITGIADIPAGILGYNRPFSKAAEAAGEATGFTPGKWAEEANQDYSPEMQTQQANINQAWDSPDTNALDIAKTYVTNPRATLGNVVESMPSMIAGGVLGRAATGLNALSKEATAAELIKRGTLAGGVGEGAIMAGQSMDNIDDSVDPRKAALGSAAIGIGGGLIGTQSGRLANKLGLGDVNTLVASQGRAGAGSNALSMGKRILGSGAQEGLLEEAPQSALETGVQNYVEGNPITQGMGRAVTEGAIAGTVMGAPAGIPRGPLGNALSKAIPTNIDESGDVTIPSLSTKQPQPGTAQARLGAYRALQRKALGETNATNAAPTSTIITGQEQGARPLGSVVAKPSNQLDLSGQVNETDPSGIRRIGDDTSRGFDKAGIESAVSGEDASANVYTRRLGSTSGDNTKQYEEQSGKEAVGQNTFAKDLEGSGLTVSDVNSFLDELDTQGIDVDSLSDNELYNLSQQYKKDKNVQQDESLLTPTNRSELQDSQARNGAETDADAIINSDTTGFIEQPNIADGIVPDGRVGVDESNIELTQPQPETQDERQAKETKAISTNAKQTNEERGNLLDTFTPTHYDPNDGEEFMRLPDGRFITQDQFDNNDYEAAIPFADGSLEQYEPIQKFEQTRTAQQETQGADQNAPIVSESSAQKTIQAEPVATGERVVDGLADEQQKTTNIDTTTPQEGIGSPAADVSTGQGAGAKQGKEKVKQPLLNAIQNTKGQTQFTKSAAEAILKSNAPQYKDVTANTYEIVAVANGKYSVVPKTLPETKVEQSSPKQTKDAQETTGTEEGSGVDHTQPKQIRKDLNAAIQRMSKRAETSDTAKKGRDNLIAIASHIDNGDSYDEAFYKVHGETPSESLKSLMSDIGKGISGSHLTSKNGSLGDIKPAKYNPETETGKRITAIINEELVKSKQQTIQPTVEEQLDLEPNNEEKKAVAKYYAQQANDKKNHIVLNEGNGKVINDLYSQWNSIKTKEDSDNFKRDLVNTKFGTYGTLPFHEVLVKFEPKFPNDIVEKAFIGETKKILKSPDLYVGNPLVEEQVKPPLAVTNANNEASNWIKKNVSKDQIETLQTRFNENKEFQRDSDKFNRYARAATGHIEGSKAIDFYSAFAPDINVGSKQEPIANKEQTLTDKEYLTVEEPIKQTKPTKRKTVSKEDAAHFFGQDKKIGYGKENKPFSKAWNAQTVLGKRKNLDDYKVIQSGNDYWIVHNNYPMQDGDVDVPIISGTSEPKEKENVKQDAYIGANLDNEKIYEKSDGSRYIDHGNLIENESISIVPTQQGVKTARNERKNSFKTTDEYVKDNVDNANKNLPYSFEIKDNGESLDLYHNGKVELEGLSRINGVSEAIRRAHLINDRNIKKEQDDRDNTIKAAKDSDVDKKQYGANNKLVTQARREELQAKLKAKLGQLNAGIDPEIMSMGAELAVFHIEAGVRKFADVVQQIAQDLDIAVGKLRPYARSWYTGAKLMLEDSGENVDDMDDADVVTAEFKRIFDAKESEKAEEPIATINVIDFNAAQAFSKKLLAGESFRTIIQARRALTEQKIESGTQEAKQADEAIELAGVLAAREIVAKVMNESDTFDALVKLADQMPSLNVRTSESIAQQAYSTPLPLAYVASIRSGINKDSDVLEPSAGNGALVIAATPENVLANELNADRAKALKGQGFSVIERDASSAEFGSKNSDVVIANPPFGVVKDADGKSVTFKINEQYKTNEIDHAIALNALKAMRDDGKAVLIVGGPAKTLSDAGRSDAYNGKAKVAFYHTLYNNYNVTDHFTVSGSLYAKQGAAWPVDVIVIEGRGKSKLSLPAADLPRIINSIAELKNELQSNRDSLQSGGKATKPATGERTTTDNEGSGTDDVGFGSGESNQNEQQPSILDRPGVDNKGTGTGQYQGDKSKGNSTIQRPDGLDNKTDTKSVQPTRVKNKFQAEYKPSSSVDVVGTLVPVNMQQSIKSALDKLKDKYGSVDDFVAYQLNYEPSELGKYFSAEQVDAIALALDNINSGKGFIIGDQTGVGKGRVNAAMIKYAMLNKITPIFVTEKPNLYSDMIRDLTDIGVTDIMPLATNNGDDGIIPLNKSALAWDSANEQAKENKEQKPPVPNDAKFAKVSDAKKADILQGRDIQGYDAIFTTYSQMQTRGDGSTPRIDFLNEVANGALLILDESHNAGGTSGRGDEEKVGRAGVVRALVNKAKGVFYSSATYAKRPDVLDLYSKTDMGLIADPKTLKDSLVAGGVPLQQAVASMLAKAGQYIRREKSFDGINYDTVVVDVDRDFAENSSTIMRDIMKFDSLKGASVKRLDNELKADGRKMTGTRATGGAGAESANFASVMHNMIGQMLLILKVQPTIDQTLESLKRGEKPVITVSNTMGAAIDDFVAETGLNPGDAINLNFGNLLKRYLKKSRMITEKDAMGNKRVREMTDEELGPNAVKFYKAVGKKIDSLEFDKYPVSPIDAIHNALHKAGYKTGEITGRSSVIDYSGEMPIFKKRPGSQRTSAGKRKTINDFNNGLIDVVVLNQSGATGISLHASPKVGGDTRKRHMIIAQAELNIDTHMQILGRINRTGQIVLPSYAQLTANIPAEKRPSSILAKKMAMLNANTTAGKESAVKAKDVPDFMNDYGDEIAAAVMNDHREIHALLGSPLVQGTNGFEPEGAMRKVTGRIPVLSLKDQEALYNTIEEAYNEYIDTLNKTGQNELEAQAMNLDAKTTETIPVVTQVGDSESPFAEGVNAEKVSVKRLGKPYTLQQITDLIKKLGVTDRESKSQWQTKALDNIESVYAQRLNQINAIEPADDMEANRKEQSKITLEQQANDVKSIVRNYPPATAITLISPMGIDYPGYIGNFERKGDAKNYFAKGNWKVTFYVADAAKQFVLPLSKIGTEDSQWKIEQSNAKDVNEALEEGQSTSREDRIILTGNMLSAYSFDKSGRIINYTTDQGNVKQGVLMPKKFNVEQAIDKKPIIFSSPDLALEYIKTSDNPAYGIRSNNNDIRLLPQYNGLYTLYVPKSKAKGGNVYLNTRLTDLVGNFISSGKDMFVRISQDKIDEATRILYPLSGPMQPISKNNGKAFLNGKGIKFSKKDNASSTNTHTPTSLKTAMQQVMDKEYGDGWFERLLATGKFKIINSSIAKQMAGVGSLFHAAWHGSPHDHEGFDSSKIGTGEGAQAFGYGHYFTDAKGIAEWYKNELSKKELKLNGKVLISRDSIYGKRWLVDEELEKAIPDVFVDKAKLVTGKEAKKLKDDLAEIVDDIASMEKEGVFILNDQYPNDIIKKRFADWLRTHDLQVAKGKLYNVELAPEQDEYLDWDKPLSEQSDKIKAIYNDKFVDNSLDLDEDEDENYNTKNGEYLYKSLTGFSASAKDAKAASEYLRKLGIRGIRYKAEAGKNEANNYVIFDDADIKMVAKYSRDGKTIQAFYNPSNDTTYFVADNINKGVDLFKLAQHEIGVHALELGKDSKEFQAIMEDMLKLVQTSKPLQTAYTKALESFGIGEVPLANKPINGVKREDVLHEVAGYLVEKYPRLSHVQKLIAWMRNAIRNLGKALPALERMKWVKWANSLKPDDVVYMAISALKKAPESLLMDSVGRSGDAVLMAKAQGINADDYPIASDKVDGRTVLATVPNRSSISSTLNDYSIVKGIREVSFDIFKDLGKLKYESSTEKERTQKLAKEIDESKEISPLIVVIDKDGPYILEGGHRFDALRELNAKSFPALVVVDNESFDEIESEPEQIDKKALEELFTSLSPRAKQSIREAAQERIDDFKDSDKIRYVEENFYDMLGALEESGKVVIKC